MQVLIVIGNIFYFITTSKLKNFIDLILVSDIPPENYELLHSSFNWGVWYLLWFWPFNIMLSRQNSPGHMNFYSIIFMIVINYFQADIFLTIGFNFDIWIF